MEYQWIDLHFCGWSVDETVSVMPVIFFNLWMMWIGGVRSTFWG